MSYYKFVVPVFPLAILLSCSDSPTQPRGPRLTILAGAGISDTISASPAQGVVAEVRDSAGQPEGGVAVEFAAIPQSCNPTLSCMDLLVAPAGGPLSYTASAATDAKGRAVVTVQLGLVAGTTRLAVDVPLYGLRDTVSLTVKPGAAVSLGAAPRDTAVELGGSFQLRAGPADRVGNMIAGGAVTYASSGSALTVSASGQVSAAGEGIGWVRVSGTVAGRTLTDSARTSVVPKARIAVSDNSGPIRLTNLTGSPQKTLIPGHSVAPDWSPAGDRLAYVDDRGNNTSGISVADTLGNTRQLPTPTNSSWPQWSADGQWIYFMLLDGYMIHRIHPDGTGLDSVVAGNRVSPAPDSVRVAVSTAGGIWVGDPVTKVGGTVPNTTSAAALKWSPNGQWIAYRAGGAIVMIHPDGTGKRSWPAESAGGITWSPDSHWILGGGYASMLLIDAVNGTTMAPSVSNPLYPTWKP